MSERSDFTNVDTGTYCVACGSTQHTFADCPYRDTSFCDGRAEVIDCV